jgi:hypothetical protein
MKELRKCKFIDRRCGEEKEGYFHTWGYDYE